MLRRLTVVLAGCALLLGLPAEARFGKRGSSSPNSSSSHPSSASHGSAPLGSGGSSSGPSYSGGGYSGGYSGYGYGYGYRPRYSLGFYSGAFVPAYGYGYAYGPSYYGTGYQTGVVQQSAPAQAEPSSLRVSAGLEGQGYLTGFTLGLGISTEGERWGFSASGQNIAVRADDGSGGFDNLQVATAHVTFAFLTGRYGRLRVEGGADAVFAPNLIVVGPTAGLSGSLWIGGPFALEGSVMGSVWPFRQLDYKVGAAVGLGPVGLRAGWRTQVLDDMGLVDGVDHRDVFMGPYVGLAFVF